VLPENLELAEFVVAHVGPIVEVHGLSHPQDSCDRFPIKIESPVICPTNFSDSR
jgi:hypothetical protein